MKTAIIIGSSGGIGTALTKKLSADYKIVSVTRSGEAGSIKCDLTSNSEILSAIGDIKKEVSSVDLLIHAAGVATYKKIEQVDDKELQDAFMVNTFAPVIFTRELLPLMKSNDALVLSLGSGAGVIPMRGRSVYCATKAALRMFSLSWTEEFADGNPKFCVITLGSTLTDFGPMPLADKQAAADQGRAYFPLEWVANKLVEIINDQNREAEIVLYPSEHGFGNWKKP